MRDGCPVAEEIALLRSTASFGGGAVPATEAAVVTEGDGDTTIGQILLVAIPY